jgi:hypothetical protein
MSKSHAHAKHESGPSFDEAKADAKKGTSHAKADKAKDVDSLELNPEEEAPTPNEGDTKEFVPAKTAEERAASPEGAPDVDHPEKTTKLKQTLENLRRGLDQTEGERRNPALCQLGDCVRECCGGHDNEEAIKALDHCQHVPPAAKGPIQGVLNGLAKFWEEPSAGLKYQITEEVDKALVALR